MENPYVPPVQSAPTPAPLTPGAKRKRPGGLVAVCVIAIVLGGLGAFGALATLFGLIFPEFQSGFMPQTGPGQTNEALEINREMASRMMAVAGKYAVLNWVLTALLIVNVSLLLAGGIMTLRFSPLGRKLLLGVFVAAFLVDLARAVPGILVQTEMFAVMEELMPQMMEASAPPGQQAPPGMGDVMGTTMSIMGVVSLVLTIVWTLAKLVVYMIGAIYLTRPAVKALFT